jgi:hypothetical protein
MNQKIDRYSAEIFGNLEGWVSNRQPMMMRIIDSIHRETGVTGDIAEIGVHHGLYLMLLAAVRRDGEMIRAFDVFEDQQFNADMSGYGSRAALEGAIDRWYGKEKKAFAVHRIDSLAMRNAGLKKYFPKPVRLFSVDGGHTKIHACNDLLIAKDVICPGGVVILDDFFAVLWPVVTEGFFDFLTKQDGKLAPLLYFENKLFLTTANEQPAMLKSLREKLDIAIGEEIHNQLWKYVTIAGSTMLVRA